MLGIISDLIRTNRILIEATLEHTKRARFEPRAARTPTAPHVRRRVLTTSALVCSDASRHLRDVRRHGAPACSSPGRRPRRARARRPRGERPARARYCRPGRDPAAAQPPAAPAGRIAAAGHALSSLGEVGRCRARPLHGPLRRAAGRLRWPRTTIVLDYLVSAAATARDRGEQVASSSGLLRLLDTLATGAADVVVVDTDESAARLPAGVRTRAVVVPVGATGSGSRRRTRRAEHPDGRLRVVFFGSFTPLKGRRRIARALSDRRGHPRGHARGRRPGPRRGTSSPLGSCRRDVARLGADRRAPGLVAEPRLSAWGSSAATEKALTVVPTKIYQGAAAGCALVTSDTPRSGARSRGRPCSCRLPTMSAGRSAPRGWPATPRCRACAAARPGRSVHPSGGRSPLLAPAGAVARRSKDRG